MGFNVITLGITHEDCPATDRAKVAECVVAFVEDIKSGYTLTVALGNAKEKAAVLECSRIAQDGIEELCRNLTDTLMQTKMLRFDPMHSPLEFHPQLHLMHGDGNEKKLIADLEAMGQKMEAGDLEPGPALGIQVVDYEAACKIRDEQKEEQGEEIMDILQMLFGQRPQRLSDILQGRPGSDVPEEAKEAFAPTKSATGQSAQD